MQSIFEGIRDGLTRSLCLKADADGRIPFPTTFVVILLVFVFLPHSLYSIYSIFQQEARHRRKNTASAIEANGSKSTQDAKLPLPVTLPTRDQTALLIKKRRSIFVKDLSGEQVERSTVESMLEAANWAPTHGKTEPWRFVVMSNAELMRFIDVMIQSLDSIPDMAGKEAKAAKLESKKSKMAGVSWAIAICFKRQAGDKLMPEWEELAATSMSVQNMHLMATAEGVSGYWTSWGPEEARDSLTVKDYLSLGPEDKCIGVFLLGRSTVADSYRAKRGPLSEKVQWRI